MHVYKYIHTYHNMYHLQVAGTMVEIKHMKDEYDEMVNDSLGWIDLEDASTILSTCWHYL